MLEVESKKPHPVTWLSVFLTFVHMNDISLWGWCIELGVTPIVEKMVETRLRWFVHVERRPVDYVVRRVDQTDGSEIPRERERPRKLQENLLRKV